MRSLVATTLTIILGLSTSAQSLNDGIDPCGTNQAEAKLKALNAHLPDRITEMEEASQLLEDRASSFSDQGTAKSGSSYVIPVVVHIIHNYGPENISDAQVYDAVEVINNDFNKLNTDWSNVNPAFLNTVADVGIEFRLAQKDPNGNCTKGITRTASLLTYDGDQSMKNLIQWPRDEYMNVWIAASAAGSAGYTLTPGNVNSNWAAPADGIVIEHTYFGRIGTGSISRSRTWTHETGHWLNLRHTWGGTNDPGLTANCNSDDNVSDTPNTIGWTSCDVNGQTCSSLDNVENYMEYSYCSKMFTTGQRGRMLSALTSNTADRNDLWQPSNLAATGTDGPSVLCAADLNADHTIICAGDSVVFTDASYHGVTGWNWTFPNGDPATSTNESPIVYYNTPGIYDVSLTVDDGNSNVSITKAQYIRVLSSVGYPLPYFEGFENLPSLPTQDWSLFDAQSDGTFNINSNAAYSGSQCVKLANNTNDAGNIDEMISTTIDLSGMQEAIVTFKYAFKRRNSSNDDRLRFFVSSDCGKTWSMREQLRGQTDLPTGNDQSGSFTPSGQNDWQEVVIDNIQPQHLQSDFRFKFWFESDGGNNLYIDDINIYGTPVGIHELNAENIELSIFPNPLTDASSLVFKLKDRSDVQIDVMDVLGRVVFNLAKESLATGRHEYPISKKDLGDGMYFVRMTVNGKTTMVKFMVN